MTAHQTSVSGAPPGARFELSDVTPVEISLVPLGDNPDALVLLTKAAPGGERNRGDESADGTVTSMTSTTDATGGTGSSGAADVVEITKADWEAVQSYVAELEDVVKAAKSSKDDDMDDDDGYMDEDEDDEMDDDEDEVRKSHPELGAILDRYDRRARAAEARAEKVEKIAKSALAVAAAERDARIDVEIRKHAEALDAIAPADEIAPVLKAVHAECTPGTARSVEELLVKAAQMIDQVEEAGIGSQVRSGGSPFDSIRKSAAAADPFVELLKHATGVGLSAAAKGEEIDIDALLAADPEAYDRWMVDNFYGKRG